MKQIMALIVAAWAGAALSAQTVDGTEPDPLPVIRMASEVTLEEFLWIKRPVVVFADSPADPRFVRQIGMITERLDDLIERDVVVITDTDPGTPSEVRKKLRPRGFMLVLIGKEGDVKLRKPLPWSVREINRTIDKMPLREQEIRDRREPLQ